MTFLWTDEINQKLKEFMEQNQNSGKLKVDLFKEFSRQYPGLTGTMVKKQWNSFTKSRVKKDWTPEEVKSVFRHVEEGLKESKNLREIFSELESIYNRSSRNIRAKYFHEYKKMKALADKAGDDTKATVEVIEALRQRQAQNRSFVQKKAKLEARLRRLNRKSDRVAEQKTALQDKLTKRIKKLTWEEDRIAGEQKKVRQDLEQLEQAWRASAE